MKRAYFVFAPLLVLGLAGCVAQGDIGARGMVAPTGPVVGATPPHGRALAPRPLARGGATMPRNPSGGLPPIDAPISDRDLAGMAYRNLGPTPTGQQPNWAGVTDDNSSFRHPGTGAPCKKVKETRANGVIFDRWACPRAQAAVR